MIVKDVGGAPTPTRPYAARHYHHYTQPAVLRDGENSFCNAAATSRDLDPDARGLTPNS